METVHHLTSFFSPDTLRITEMPHEGALDRTQLNTLILQAGSLNPHFSVYPGEHLGPFCIKFYDQILVQRLGFARPVHSLSFIHGVFFMPFCNSSF